MQVSVESGEGLERRMTVELPADQVEEAVNKRLKQIGRNARMDGFRPGKVPMKMLRRQYGGQVLQEVYGEMIESSYHDALKQENLHPAGMPKIEPKTSDDKSIFSYVATLEVMPEIELSKLEGAIKRPTAEVTDEDVAEMIEKLRKQRATWEPVERAAESGDQVKINFKGLIDGEAFDGGSAEDVPLVLGSNSMIEGFESGLVGMVKEEKRNLELQFPDDYRVEELAGKPVVFEVEVNEVAEEMLPEVDEEFAREFGSETDLDKFRSDIRENMDRELKQRIRSNMKSQAMDLILDSNKIVVPAALVDEEIEALRNQAKGYMQQQQQQQSDFELPREMFEDQARRRVSLGLLITEIIKQNNIQLDDQRVRETIEEYAASYEHPEEVVKHYMSNKEQLASIQNVVLEDQVVDWVLENAEVVDEPSNFATLTQQG
jgi:trigger factor